jgi:steroid 5-alpha reductase family enzyme
MPLEIISLTTPLIYYGLLVLTLVTAVFLVAQLKGDNSIMDICYGPIFAVATWGLIILTDSHGPLAWLVATLVSVWAFRLSLRILRKNWGKPEDRRYAAWRAAWLARGRLYFIIRSYLQINVLQGIIIVIVSLPLVVAVTYGEAWPGWSVWLGGLVFLLGLGYETLADWQLDRFIAGKRAGTESATLMTRGLFRYSRRPNYFGESLLWWGLALIVLPLPYGFMALLGPITITYIVTRVTGPILEYHFLQTHPDAYRAYMATTNYLIPGPPRSH